MADTEFKDLTAMVGTDLAAGDSLLVLDATGNVTKRIVISEFAATTAEAEAGTVSQRFMTPSTTTDWAAANINGGFIVDVQNPSAAASVDFASADLNTTDYDFWEFHLIGIVPANDAVVLHARISTSATFNSGASDYKWAHSGRVISDARTGDSSGDAEIVLTENTTATYKVGSDTGEHGISGVVRVYNLESSSKKTLVTAELVYIDASGNPAKFSTGGVYDTAEANDGVQFIFDGGNVESGTIVAVGYKTS